MIFDQLTQGESYHLGPIGRKAFEFLHSLSPDAKEGRYELAGEDLFALISCYDTQDPDTSVFETHEKYVDIQILLTGREKIGVSPSAGLTLQTPYDAASDAAFYENTSPRVEVGLVPGTFVLFYPWDAHMPGLFWDKNSEGVKKVVIKIKAALLVNQGT